MCVYVAALQVVVFGLVGKIITVVVLFVDLCWLFLDHQDACGGYEKIELFCAENGGIWGKRCL